MDSSITHKGAPIAVAQEFGTWPIEGSVLENTNKVRVEFNTLLTNITPMFAKGNERYLNLVKTNLETACLFAIKGIAKPGSGVGHA